MRSHRSHLFSLSLSFLLVLASAQSLHAAQQICANSETVKQNWFRRLWIPKPSDKPLRITVDMSPSTISCTGLPIQLTVPNGQKVDVKINPSTNDDSCPVKFVVTPPPPAANAIADLISAFAKVGPLFAQGPPPPPPPPTFSLPPLKSQVMTATLTCTDTKTVPNTSILKIQSIAITYQNPPRLTASVGFVVAPGVRAFGLKTSVTGTTNGVVTTQNVVAVTSFPSAQVVPFSFANIYLIGSQKKHIDAQLGFGVNPNLSSPKVEFFASPFVFSWHDVYLSPGIHIGEHEQIANGFAVGDVLPNGVSKVPISWKFFRGFGFSVSYNLHPLVGGK
jgi:hypothetical protein